MYEPEKRQIFDMFVWQKVGKQEINGEKGGVSVGSNRS